MTNIYSSIQFHTSWPCSWSSRIIAGMLSWEQSRFGDTHRHFPELKLGLPEFNESLACFCCPETHPCHASQEVPLQGGARTESTDAWQMIIILYVYTFLPSHSQIIDKDWISCQWFHLLSPSGLLVIQTSSKYMNCWPASPSNGESLWNIKPERSINIQTCATRRTTFRPFRALTNRTN